MSRESQKRMLLEKSIVLYVKNEVVTCILLEARNKRI
jgi:hypothetical protein